MRNGRNFSRLFFNSLRSFNNSTCQTGRCVSISSRFQRDGAPLRFLISHFFPPPKIFCFILASGSVDFDESTETSVINFFPPMSLSFPRWQARELFLKRDFFAHRWMETRANYWWGTRILRSARMQGTTSAQRFQLPALACSRGE